MQDDTGAMQRPKAHVRSVANTAADILRKEIIRKINGDSYLGSEDSVAQDLGISKPSLRQATRLLEAEQLLEVRRGPGGGLHIRKPEEDVVLRTVSLYLIARAIPYREVLITQIALGAEMVSNLASNPDEAIRAKPLEYLESHREALLTADGEEFVKVGQGLSDLTGELCGNKTLALFNRALSDYGSRAHGNLLTPERCRLYADYMLRLAISIRDGNPEEARLMQREGLTALMDAVEMPADEASVANA